MKNSCTKFSLKSLFQLKKTMSTNNKAPKEPKLDKTYASDESGIYERYGLSTRSRTYAEYIEQSKSKSRRIKVSDISFIQNSKT